LGIDNRGFPQGLVMLFKGKRLAWPGKRDYQPIRTPLFVDPIEQ
jgi:hypothetical protein